MTKPIILTGDRPTGKLHIGHYVGSLKNRVLLQEEDKYDMFVFLADQQALTDHAKDPQTIVESIGNVALDYLAVGLDPSKSTIFIQSQIPELAELSMYYMNLVSLALWKTLNLHKVTIWHLVQIPGQIHNMTICHLLHTR